MTEEHWSVGRLDRRAFLKSMSALIGGGMVLGFPALAPSFTGHPSEKTIPQPQFRSTHTSRKLIYIAIDALNPAYLDLNADGMPGGTPGNWLMPNIRKFLEGALWYPNAKCYLPAATDMNHLNALAGTSSAQTGILGVWAQPLHWQTKNRPVIRNTSISFARDDLGRPVDTLFHAWKRRWPGSRTMMISGKEWVAEMFRQPGSQSGVDILVTGPSHPAYLKPPHRERFADPETDRDARCDPESGCQGFFDWKHLKSDGFFNHFRPSNTLTRLYTGQTSLLTIQMQYFPNHFPHDRWIVDATLEIFRRENPDMAYILLAECDDAGHCIGSAWDSNEFVPAGNLADHPDGCIEQPGYRLVSRRNPLIFKEAALDVIRDVDIQFGRLIRGLDAQGILDKSMVILLSDHSAVNHVATQNFLSTDAMGVLNRQRVVTGKDVYAFSVSSYGVLYFHHKKDRIPDAKSALLAHRAKNPQTGQSECPWWVLDRGDMKNGIPGVCLPGELYHSYFVDKNREHSMIWPDLLILAKNGWQIPVYNGHVPNVGIKAPYWTPPFRVYNGGHGSVDTLPIVAAMCVPGGRTGICRSDLRIADLGVTAASLFGLTFQSTTIGRDLSTDL